MKNGIRSYRVGMIVLSALGKALRLDNTMEVFHYDEFWPLASFIPYLIPSISSLPNVVSFGVIAV